MKLCECGCGNPAPIAKRTSVRLGHVKGEAVKFIQGHHNRLRIARPIEERFWEKVDRRSRDDCWEWTAGRDHHGYGWLQVGTFGNQKTERAHRISYKLHYGYIPDGVDICHHCDNPQCVNPKHLFCGTHQDNMSDMQQKGRGKNPPRNKVSGDRNGRSVFTNEEVRELRKEFTRTKISVTKFAKLHNTSLPTMWRILNRKTYQDI